MDNSDMDIDMDIDLGPLDDNEASQLVRKQAGNLTSFSKIRKTDLSQPEAVQVTLTNTQLHNHVDNSTQLPQPDLQDTAPYKVHIRGVDDLTTENLRDFSTEHFPSEPPIRVEWIDDTSANIVYDNAAIASEALDHFTHQAVDHHIPESAIQLHKAKPFSKYPSSSLLVRKALSTDQKRPRAYEASRFYMMHPEYDPREKRRRDRSSHNSHGNYRRRIYSHEKHNRRRSGNHDNGFSPSMYDDDKSTLDIRGDAATSRRDSRSMHSTRTSSEHSNSGERRVRHRRHHDSYRPRRRDGIHRDRSASPGIERDDDRSHSERRRPRKRTPPPSYQTRDPHPTPQENRGKELFPSKHTLDTDTFGAAKELFRNTKVDMHSTKELFPNKLNTISHRRSDAFDAADETANLFAARLSGQFTGGVANGLSRRTITTEPSNYGRLKSSDPDPDSEALADLENGGLSILGASKNEDQGFAIWGVANDILHVERAKELFPEKATGNVGKELFAAKLEGRGTRRNRAEDMFY